MKGSFLLLALSLSCGSVSGGAVAGAPGLVGSDGWGLLSPKGTADLKTLGAGPAQTLQVTVHKQSTPYYLTQLTHDIGAGVPAGTHLQYHFWARSATGNPVHVVIEKRTAPYSRVMEKFLTLTPAWKEYTFSAAVPSAYGPRGMAARLQVGQKSGVMEFKGLALTQH